MPDILARTKSRNYPIVIGSQVLNRLKRLMAEAVGKGRVFVFFDANVYALHGQILTKYIDQSGHRWNEMVLPTGERIKSRASLAKIQDYLLSEQISRSDLIIAIGGGVTSDLVGYAAVTTLRGIPWAVIPTTLLGMVDAAIGGKTGINHRLGKNLIGAFWQPSFVLNDTCFLNTLPRREMIAGLGEVVKYGGLVGTQMLRALKRYQELGDLYHQAALVDLTTIAASYKVRLVARDERDQGLRMLLNLGHTFGHAIETALGHGRLRHGEAVLLGLWGAVELTALHRKGTESGLRAFRELIEMFIPLLPKRTLVADRIIEAMRLDKKRDGKRVRFVLLERPGRAFIAEDVRLTQVRRAVRNMVKIYRRKGE